MKITFQPIRHGGRLELHKSGDVLTINGMSFDFGALAEGQVLPRGDVESPWLASDVTRTAGQICLALLLPHGPNAPDETRFADMITATDGPIDVPPYDVPPEVENYDED